MLTQAFIPTDNESAQLDSHILQKYMTISGQTLERFFQYRKNAHQSTYRFREKLPFFRWTYLWIV